jgi:hypothetical protein
MKLVKTKERCSMKSGKRCFTKIRKWADQVGATIQDSTYFDEITITLPNGKKFRAEQKESTSTQVISRGRGLKWSGSPAGFYFGKDIGNRIGHTFESTQSKAIKEMKESL